MRLIRGALRLSASDLMVFAGCRHASALDLRRLEVGDVEPAAAGEEAELLRRRGDDHERAHLDGLRAGGRHVVEIPREGLSLETSVALTAEALAAGPDVVFQGALLGGAWGGYSDFLERVGRPSALGAFSYEVVDTKLKRSPDPKHVLQLALYSDLLADVQELAPARAHLELGDGTRATIRLADVSAYARVARLSLERFVRDRPATRPEPAAACALCRWRAHCGAEWDRADALSLVAGSTRAQRARLEAAGVDTLAALAVREPRVPGMAEATLARLRVQARLQSARRAGGPPTFELRGPVPGRGFDLLPEPAPGDVFYDIEGDPHYPDGLEYLHGVWFEEAGGWAFRAFWAHDRDAEGAAVLALLGFLDDRVREFPGARVYHYGHYEVAALRRLTASHGVGEDVLDTLLRGHRFVDLHRVVAGGLVAGEPGYSIKDLEAFYMDKRDGDVATAGASVVFYERWRDTGDDALLDRIRDYNETDCVSTRLLRDWLVNDVRPADLPWPEPGLPALADGSGHGSGDVDGDQAPTPTDRAGEVEVLQERLGLVAARLGDDAATLLADLAGFHRREDRPAWWAVYDRLGAEPGELLDDVGCLGGLEAVGPAVPVTARSAERTYAFPPQETRLRAGDRPCVRPADRPLAVELRAIDRAASTVTVRRSVAGGPLPDRLDLIPPMPVRSDALRASVLAVAGTLASARGSLPHVEDLLARAAPRFVDGRTAIVERDGGDLAASISSAVGAMAGTALGVQGPPGSGKTHAAALSIVDLVGTGRRVAVSSNSHEAIANLLGAVAARAAADAVPCRVVRKGPRGSPDRDHGVEVVASGSAAALAAAEVVGATAWHFAAMAEPAFDHLVVDEAGQVPLANVVAMARCARNLVLVGDPMQLPQPLQGTHPRGAGRSCLEHLAGGARVVPPDRGVFMPVSFRMQAGICEFVSDLAYEGRLSSDPAASAQSLVLADGLEAAGIRLEAVAHAGRSQVCPEEVEAARALVASMVGGVWRGRDGRVRRLLHGDFIVVAPYNAQVEALRAALPAGVRVGTVDRLQGQEAAVCLVSMTTSSADDMPRDVGFLLSPNRLNVAVSRAQVAAVVLASPALLEIPCRTVAEMRLVDPLCRLAGGAR